MPIEKYLCEIPRREGGSYLGGSIPVTAANRKRFSRSYELSEKETFNAAEGPVSKFIRGHLARDSRLTWKELKEEYADEGTEIEAMRSLIKLVQIRGETPGELRVRTEKMATLVFPGVGKRQSSHTSPVS